jgi:photosystem II stability/assembly factor-like uncharacterized protein
VKKYFFITSFITLLLSNQLLAQASWQIIKSPVDVNLTKIVYLDSLHLWAAGDSGTIIFSGDQGESWQVQSNMLENEIVDIFFINHSRGWALTWYFDGLNLQSQILFTADGGNSWDRQNFQINNSVLQTIFFLDSLNGWTAGNPIDLSFTTDGGLTWSPANLDTSALCTYPVSQIRFSNAQYGFAVGGAIDIAGAAWFTSNGGNSWKGYLVAPDIFSDFLFLDSINTMSLSADIEGLYPIGILNYNLQQNFWNYSEINFYGRVSSVARRTSNEICGTISTDYNFIVSKDNGLTWDLVQPHDSVLFFDIAFADSSKGFAVGERGYVLKYIPLPPSSAENENEILHPNEFHLYQNFPNPFNPSTKIRFTIALPNLPEGEDLRKVSLKVYDVLGNEVGELLNEYKPAGNYEVEFNHVEARHGVSLPSGVYFYRLTAGNSSSTKKMLLLR